MELQPDPPHDLYTAHNNLETNVADTWVSKARYTRPLWSLTYNSWNAMAFSCFVICYQHSNKIVTSKEIDSLLWSQIWVAMAQEHRFRLLQISCSKMETISWGFCTKNNNNINNQTSGPLVEVLVKWAPAEWRNLSYRHWMLSDSILSWCMVENRVPSKFLHFKGFVVRLPCLTGC